MAFVNVGVFLGGCPFAIQSKITVLLRSPYVGIICAVHTVSLVESGLCDLSMNAIHYKMCGFLASQ